MKVFLLSIFITAIFSLPISSAEQDIKNRQNAMQQVRESIKVVKRKTINEKYEDKLKKAQAAKGKK